MYINSWPEFQQAAEALYTSAPDRTRYCVKWRATEGLLVLKITDDTTCLKYKTHSSIFLNRFEALNLSLMEKMSNRVARPVSPPETRAGTPAESQPVASTAGAPSSATPAAGGSVAAGGVKKKKKGKKK
ncbi:signal recognition particle, SRP9/SRP14 subunit [Sistotremastrum niveocremeum HHB9708]|uniref:Signal recognition particle, SRP9/SRP14 subunit n=2 Tax=Sistotremastraceae TaxID=3402574 RepID=A0A164WU31_9AGAM|nr:signal recognition particle, SRP9/SRP14 subunit [Sistotremastrum niveocremeum HHB9708]KZT37173.1 signal recognition particle, SRP9/SRP14 subunit [Sistotremastrum suecicum HHB10207 ss-3]